MRDAESSAFGWLKRKALTGRELAARLRSEGHDQADVEALVESMAAGGWIDDLGLSIDFISARASRLGHGPLRLIAELERRGVAKDDARRGWDEAVRRGYVDPEAVLDGQIRRRLTGQSRDRKTFARVYNALLRAGFDAAAIRRRLVSHGWTEPVDGSDHDREGLYDDFA